MTIPIVFISSDPVKYGLVASFSRPGGNATGFSVLGDELLPKRLELLSELVPQARVIALLVNPNNTDTERSIVDMQEAARVKGVQLHILKAGTEIGIDAAFASVVQLVPLRSSSAPIRSSTAGASNLWRWHHAMPFQRSIGGASTPLPAA